MNEYKDERDILEKDIKALEGKICDVPCSSGRADNRHI